MEVDFRELPDQAKVWMYQASRPLTDQEKTIIYDLAEVFLKDWESHNIPVQGSVDILNNLFIRVAAFTDEPSMCGRAQDAQVRLVKQIEDRLSVVFTDRMLLAFEVNGSPQVVHLNDISDKVQEGVLNPKTVFFNNLIGSKSEFETAWKTAAAATWLERYF